MPSASMSPQLVSRRPVPDVAPTCLYSTWSPRSWVLDATRSNDNLYPDSVFPCRGRQEADPGSNVMASSRSDKFARIWLVKNSNSISQKSQICSFRGQFQNSLSKPIRDTTEHPKARRIYVNSARAVRTADRIDRNPEDGYFQPEIDRYPVSGTWNSTTLSSDICRYCKTGLNCCNSCYLDIWMFAPLWHLLLIVELQIWERLNWDLWRNPVFCDPDLDNLKT